MYYTVIKTTKNETAKQMICRSRQLLSMTRTPSLPIWRVLHGPTEQNQGLALPCLPHLAQRQTLLLNAAVISLPFVYPSGLGAAEGMTTM